MASVLGRAARAGLLCASFWLASFAQPAHADLVWGANGHPFTAYGGVPVEQQLGFLQDLGLKSYRVNISELRASRALEQLLDKAKPLGIEILPVLTPSLDLDKLSSEELRRGAHDFAFALVSRFKDRIKAWELGNELEVYAIIRPCEMQDDGKQYNCDWGPAGGNGVLDYYGPRWAKASAVLKGLSEGTIAADRTAKKAMGTAGWGHTGAFERMRRDGIKWDISVWHMYGEDPEWAFKLLAGYGQPIWVTEMNHPRGSEPGERQQANGLRRWMERLAELAPRYKVEAVHLYELLDETYWAPDMEAVMGLVRLERSADGGWQPGAPKPAYDAARAMLRGEERWPSVRRDCALERMIESRPPAEGHIAYLYCLLLSRQADGGGLQEWTAQRRDGASVAAILQRMAGSEEFATRYRAPFLSDDRYIALVYRLLLSRDPDGQGRADYGAALREGHISRIGLIGAIAGSDEFRDRHKLLFQES
jgi:hypothetical protein